MDKQQKQKENNLAGIGPASYFKRSRPYVLLMVLLLLMLGGTWWVDHRHEVKIKLSDGYLYGDILRPQKPLGNCVIVITAGSGPTDRDGNSDILTGNNDSLKALAYGLTEEGYATFRYDQRSAGKTRLNTTKDLNTLTFEVMVEDLVEVIKTMKEHEKFDTIILVGHSQGAMVSTLATQLEAVDGVINLCGATRPIDEVLLWQLKQQNLPEFDEIQKVIQSLKQGNHVTEMSKNTARFLGTGVQDFLISWMAYDPYTEAKKLKVPNLLVFGSEDLQVPPAEKEYLKDLAGPDTSVVLLGMNHVLKQVKIDDKKDNLASYTDPSYALNQELISVILDFAEGVN